MKFINTFQKELRAILLITLAAGLGRQLIVEGDKAGGLIGVTSTIAGLFIIAILGGWLFNERSK